MSTDQAQRNKQSVLALYSALTGGGATSAYTIMQQLLDRDVIVYHPDSLPFGGTHHGREAFLTQSASNAGRHVDARRIKLEGMVAEGDDVVVRWRFPFRINPTDEFVDVEVNEWLTFRDGKIVEARPFYWDTAQLVRSDGPNDRAGRR
jgi:ketosteroid isomerase-like protein